MQCTMQWYSSHREHTNTHSRAGSMIFTLNKKVECYGQELHVAEEEETSINVHVLVDMIAITSTIKRINIRLPWVFHSITFGQLCMWFFTWHHLVLDTMATIQMSPWWQFVWKANFSTISWCCSYTNYRIILLHYCRNGRNCCLMAPWWIILLLTCAHHNGIE